MIVLFLLCEFPDINFGKGKILARINPAPYCLNMGKKGDDFAL